MQDFFVLKKQVKVLKTLQNILQHIGLLEPASSNLFYTD